MPPPDPTMLAENTRHQMQEMMLLTQGISDC
jgi:hypothetical protein